MRAAVRASRLRVAPAASPDQRARPSSGAFFMPSGEARTQNFTERDVLGPQALCAATGGKSLCPRAGPAPLRPPFSLRWARWGVEIPGLPSPGCACEPAAAKGRGQAGGTLRLLTCTHFATCILVDPLLTPGPFPAGSPQVQTGDSRCLSVCSCVVLSGSLSPNTPWCARPCVSEYLFSESPRSSLSAPLCSSQLGELRARRAHRCAPKQERWSGQK